MEKKEYIYHHKYILGLTSLWLLVPSVLNIYENGFVKYNFLLFITIFVSTIFWGYFFYESLFHKLDRFFATLLYIVLQIFLINKLNIINIILSLCVPIFFYTARYYYLINKQNKVLIYHLIFRYFGFWLTFKLLTNNIITKTSYILYTIFYLLHILKLFKNLEKIKNINDNNLEKNFKSYYNTGIIETILIISGILFSQIVFLEYIKLK